MPRSVASRLNCAAAFLVSWISIRMPNEFRYARVEGEIGYVEGPRPRTTRSEARSVPDGIVFAVLRQPTRLWPDQIQDPPSFISACPLALGVQQPARPSLPGSPGEGLPGHKEHAAAPGHLQPVVQLKAVGQASVDRGRRRDSVVEYIELGKVRLGVLLGRWALAVSAT